MESECRPCTAWRAIPPRALVGVSRATRMKWRQYTQAGLAVFGLGLTMSGALAAPETRTGRVIKVADGDTLTLREARGSTQRIRLLAIDAPETDQAHGPQATRALRQRVQGKTIEARCPNRDRYGRLVCQVFLNGQDIGLESLKNGHAWFYRQFSKGLSATERRAYEAAEQKARKARYGLWKDAKAIAPWAWRQQNRR